MIPNTNVNGKVKEVKVNTAVPPPGLTSNSTHITQFVVEIDQIPGQPNYEAVDQVPGTVKVTTGAKGFQMQTLELFVETATSQKDNVFNGSTPFAIITPVFKHFPMKKVQADLDQLAERLGLAETNLRSH